MLINATLTQYERILAQREQMLRQCLQMVFMSTLSHIATGIIIIIHKHRSQCKKCKPWAKQEPTWRQHWTVRCTQFWFIISSSLYLLPYFHGLLIVMSKKVVGLVRFHCLSSVHPQVKDCKEKRLQSGVTMSWNDVVTIPKFIIFK